MLGIGKVEIFSTIIRNNGGYALELQDGASADISNTKMLSNHYGGTVVYTTNAASTTATMSDSIVSGGSIGVWAANASARGSARIFIARSTVQNTTNALESSSTGGGNALVAVSSSMVTNNSLAWSQSGNGAVIESSGQAPVRR